ncbi:MAG: hypothetical protein M1836_005271 [Candelina mexicana]|nr:MAG: hypothetical protein M1836_005271 [Candelina mexicana]
MPLQPETYTLHPTPHVPNSPLPVLLYRSALPPNPTASNTRVALENNGWLQGGVFKTVTAHHYHSVTHECYAIFRGSSKLLLGRGPLDDAEGAVEVDVRAGDVIVLPAGVAHCSLSSEGDYEYLGLYPKVRVIQIKIDGMSVIASEQGSPPWDNNFCKAGPDETEEKARACRNVPLPDYDPVFGVGGPLVDIWSQVAASNL